jgi:hypothetical protein
MGTTWTEYSETIKVDGVKSENDISIIIEDFQKNYLYYFDKKVDFDNITDTTTFYLQQGYTMYGKLSSDKFVYYKVDGKFFLGKIKK